MTSYQFVKRMSEELVVLKSYLYQDIWDRGTARKVSICQVTGEEIKKGDSSWRPITNGNNRMHRISDAGIKQLEME